MFNKKNISKTIALCLGVLVMSFLVGYLVLAWTEPSTYPPGGNVYAPINVGPNGQTKEGGILVANNSGVTYGLIVRYGSVGIGTTGPDAKLDVLSSGTQLRLTYTDGSVYSDFAVDSSGNLTITPSGSKISLASGKGLVLGSNTTDLTGVNGMMYYNTTLNKFRCYQGGAWTDCKGIDAPVDASYLVLNLNNTLTNERVLSAGAGLESIDSGANGFFTLRINMAGISTCTNPTTNKIIWDSTNNRLTCATDQTGAGGGYWTLNTGVTPNTLYPNDTTWNVGIGTTSPGYKLDIAGALRLQPTSSIPSLANGVIYYDSTANKFKCFQAGDWFDCVGGYWAASGTNISNTNTGNVGIGTGPSYKLDVNGDINTSGVYRQGGTAGVSVTCSSGNTPSGITISGGIVTSAGSCTAIGGGGGYWTLNTGVTPNTLYPNDTTWKVGIGTTSPGAKLDISNTNVAQGLKVSTSYSTTWNYGGNFSASGGSSLNAAVVSSASGPAGSTTYGVYASASGGSNNYGIYSSADKNYFSGNVGIGADPTQKLDVNGNLNVSGGYYQGGTRGLPGADIRPGARITLSHRLASSCTGDYNLAIYYIAVPAGKTLRVWSMGKSGEPSNSGVMVDNIDDGLAPIKTTSYYLEGSPLLTATAGQRVYFDFDCNGSESVVPAGYWVISIE